MRKRINIIVVAVVLAIGSFAFARYRYVDKNTATIGEVRLTNPLRDTNLFGDWMKQEAVFAIIFPVALMAGGLVWALKK